MITTKHIASIGIDLGKTTSHLVALDEHGKIVGKKKVAGQGDFTIEPQDANACKLRSTCTPFQSYGTCMRAMRHVSLRRFRHSNRQV